MGLLGGLEQTGPVLLLELLLPQNQLNLTVIVVHLGVLGVDLAVQVEGDIIVNALLGVSREGDVGRGDGQLGTGLVDIGGLDVDVQVVALGLSGRRPLGPRDCELKKIKGLAIDLRRIKSDIQIRSSQSQNCPWWCGRARGS